MTAHLELHDGQCWICGCTDDQACVFGCWWVPDPTQTGDLCSCCVELAVSYQQIAAVLKHPNNICHFGYIAEKTGMRVSALQLDVDCLCGHGLLERVHLRGETVYRLAAGAPALRENAHA